MPQKHCSPLYPVFSPKHHRPQSRVDLNGALHHLPASASDLISVSISQRRTWLVRGVRGREKQHADRSAQTQAALLQTKAGHTASSDAQTQQACAQQIDTTWQAHSSMTFGIHDVTALMRFSLHEGK